MSQAEALLFWMVKGVDVAFSSFFVWIKGFLRFSQLVRVLKR
ncbi:MAG: hypothetical protein QG670_2837, partial [Thermoproteota archaeon]|nr:hypothetical protein [Thermoproteota archaeon]